MSRCCCFTWILGVGDHRNELGVVVHCFVICDKRWEQHVYNKYANLLNVRSYAPSETRFIHISMQYNWCPQLGPEKAAPHLRQIAMRVMTLTGFVTSTCACLSVAPLRWAGLGGITCCTVVRVRDSIGQGDAVHLSLVPPRYRV